MSAEQFPTGGRKMPQREQYNRNPDHDIRATPEQRAFAIKKAKAERARAQEEAEKAARFAAEDEMYLSRGSDPSLAALDAINRARMANDHIVPIDSDV